MNTTVNQRCTATIRNRQGKLLRLFYDNPNNTFVSRSICRSDQTVLSTVPAGFLHCHQIKNWPGSMLLQIIALTRPEAMANPSHQERWHTVYTWCHSSISRTGWTRRCILRLPCYRGTLHVHLTPLETSFRYVAILQRGHVYRGGMLFTLRVLFESIDSLWDPMSSSILGG